VDNQIKLFGYLFRSGKASENVEREKQTTSLTPVRFALCVRPVLIFSCCCTCSSTSRKGMNQAEPNLSKVDNQIKL